MRKLLLLGGVAAGALMVYQRLPLQVKTPLKNKIVLITGASTGIGRAAALHFASRGAKVVLVARREHELNDVAAEIDTQYGTETLVIPADLTLEKDLNSVVEEVNARFGRIDVLVNNAGMFLGGPLEEANPKAVRKLLAVNVQSVIRLTQMILPGMIRRGHGHIVNVSSMTTLLGAPGASVYAASKVAVNGFSAALRRELIGTGVGVTTVMPGWTRTEMMEGMDDDEMRAAGMLNPFFTVDTADTVGKAIVDAVRHDRVEVLFGGPLVRAAAWVTRLFPGVYDFYYARVANRQDVMELLRTPEAGT